MKNFISWAKICQMPSVFNSKSAQYNSKVQTDLKVCSIKKNEIFQYKTGKGWESCFSLYQIMCSTHNKKKIGDARCLLNKNLINRDQRMKM